MKISQYLSLASLVAALWGASPQISSADTRKPVLSIPQSASVKGTWNCFVTTSRNESSNETYTFTQTGNKFTSNSDETSFKVYGTIDGTSIKISRVVNGEFLEGYVMYAEGHIIGINGKSNNGIVTVYHDSQAGIGSFNCLKQ